MTKMSYLIVFKKEVIAYMEEGNSCYKAELHFYDRNNYNYSQSMFQQWFQNKEKIKATTSFKLRISGAGRKTTLGGLEDQIFDEIINLRLNNVKVTRTYISDRAINLPYQNRINLDATGNWISGFVKKKGLSLRLTTNLTTLTNDELINRAVNYMLYLDEQKKQFT